MRIVLINPTLRQLRQAIAEAQSDANGNMRARTIADHQIADWAKNVKSRKSGRHSVHGGHVANAYKYHASAAAIYCYWATDPYGRKHVLIVGHQVNAKAGSGIGHPIPSNVREKLEAEKRLLELVYPDQHVTDGDILWAPEGERPFLRAIKAAPKDAAPRLVFADWLDENGQSERAETIRSIWMAPAEKPKPIAKIVITTEGEVVLVPQN